MSFSSSLLRPSCLLFVALALGAALLVAAPLASAQAGGGTSVTEELAPSGHAAAPGSMHPTPNAGAPRFVEHDGSNNADHSMPASGKPAPISAPPSGSLNPQTPAPTASFEGAHNTVDCTVPPDSDGAVGPTYYLSFVNNYNKCATGPGTGNVQFFCKAVVGNCTSVGQVKGGFYISDLYTGVSGGCSSATQHTDPQAVYDSAKDRYLLVDITTTSPYKVCVAASLSNDPIWGSWCVSSISAPTTTLPDYEKIGIWPDGLYIGTQDNGIGASTTHHIVVVNKDDMESCAATIHTQTVTMASDTSKTTYGCGTSNGHQGPRPASYDITTGIPAAGEPEFIVADYCLNNALFVDTLRVNWTNSANTLLTKGSLTVQTTSLAPSTVSNSGSDKMDTLRLELMPTATYYKDGSGNEYLFTDQTVQGSSSTLSAIAWYQLKVVNNVAGGTVQNQNIWNPDSTNRLDGAGTFDRNGDIMMSYTQASSTLAPAVAYAGRLATDAANTFGQTESILFRGSGYSGTCSGTCTRWGDYSSNFIDVDGCTYWFTGEVYRQTGDAWQWTTQIGAAQYAGCTPLTSSASSTSSLSFAASGVGVATSPQTITITNGGTAPLVLQAAKLGGANAADFTITQDNCGGQIVAAAGTCTVLVKYTPSTSGTESATVSVGDNTAAAHNLVTSLTGTVAGGTPPTTSASTSGTSGSNGWFRSAVTVTLTCTPGGATTCVSTWYTLDGGALTHYTAPFSIPTDLVHTVLYNSTSSDGGVETQKTLTVKIDATAPSVSATNTTCATPGNNGWCKVSFQTVTTSASDATSGVSSTSCTLDGSTVTCGSITVGQGSHVVNVTSTDLAGNSATASVTIKNDSTPPVTCSGSFAGATAGTNGWFLGPGTETLTASDSSPGSGVSSFTYTVDGTTTTYSGPFGISLDGQHAITCQITDLAGNVGGNTSAGTVKIDSVAPTSSETFTCGVAGSNGWCRDASRTVTTSASDATSGVGSQACTRDGVSVTCGSVTVNTQGTHAVCDTPTDLAGNVGAQTCTTIKLDNVAPSASVSTSCSAVGLAGWCIAGSASFTTSASDATSGVASEACTLDGVSHACGNVPAPQGSHTVCDTPTDAAGNVGSQACATLMEDNVAPLLSGSASPAANANGWNAGSVTVHFTCSDATSGVGSVTSDQVVSGEGAGQSRSGSCTDVAGNSASASVGGINIDLTPPTIAAHGDITAEATSASGALATYSAPTASDALSGAGSVTCAPASGGTFALGSTTVTCSAADLAGNVGSGAFHVTVVDTTAPAIDAHADITAEATAPAGALVSFTAPATHDVVDGVGSATCSPASGSTFGLGATQVQCTATDAHGNSASSSFTVSVADTTPPTISAVSDLVREATGPSGALVSFASPTTSDAVDGAGVATCAPASGSTFPLGSTTITCTATDAHGNTASASFQTIVADTTAPVLDAHDDITSEATTPAGAVVSYDPPAWNDAVDGSGSASCSPVSGSAFAMGSTTVTCGATDAHGNAASSTFVVLVADTTPPAIDAHADVAAEATSAAGAVVSYVAPATHDGVDGDGVASCAPASGSTFALGTTSVVCSAHDAAGNAASATSFAVRVADTTAPVIAAHDDVAAEATSAAGAVVSFAASATTDAVDGAGVATCAPASGSQFALGATTVTCAAHDAAGNAATSMSFVVHVADTTAPTIGAVSDLVREATGPAGALVTFVSPDTSDAVDGPGVATCAPASGSTFPLGSSTITCTATDEAGNTASRSFQAIVVDTTAPTIDAQPEITAEATGSSGAVVSYSAPATHDAVDGTGSASCSPASGSTFALGDTVLTCSAADAHGNAATPTHFTIHVVDTTAPTIDAHDDITGEATGSSGAIVSYTAPATHDAVDGTGSASCSPASGSAFPFGASVVTCTARDAAGNAASAVSFAVRVVDTTAPVIAAHADVAAEATSSAGAIVSYAAPATTDAVDGAGVATCAPASGSPFALGTTAVTCTARDAAGNGATSTSFLVIVRDTTPPAVDALNDITAEATAPAGAVVRYDAPASHDLVDGDGVATCSPASGSLFALGETAIVCTATDAHGNGASASFRVTVVDTTAPVIDAHSDITSEATAPTGAVVSYDPPATHDAVDGNGVATCAPASGSQIPLGSTTIVCSATDGQGNHATSTSFLARVVDTTPPLIDAHPDLTFEATTPSGAVVGYASPATHDAVDGAGMASCSPLSGSGFPRGATRVTCSATDAAGNSASSSFMVRVGDTTPPTIAPHADVAAEAASAAGAVVGYDAPATHDAVDGDGVASCAPASGSTFPLGATAVTCDARDAAGNDATSTSFLVRVEDTTAPTVAAHSDITSEATAPAGAIVSFDAPATSDAVDGAGVATCAPASGATFAPGSTVVSCGATDAAGNAATPARFRVVVVDTTPPAIDAHDDITASASGADGGLVAFDAPAWRDLVSGEGVATCAPSSGSLLPLGDTTIQCSATDSAGNTAASSFVAHVVDATAPELALPAPAPAEATSAAGATVTYVVSARDAVDGNVASTCAPASGSVFALGATSVFCSATDAAGNTARGAFTIVVRDTTPPTVATPADMTIEATGVDGAPAVFSADANDLVDGPLPADCTPASGSAFPLGATTVACSAMDAAGNQGSASFVVHVVDTTAPVIAPHADIEVEASSLAGALVTYAAPTTRDAVSGAGVATCAPASGSLLAVGATTVTCTARDAAGNAAAPTSFVVRVTFHAVAALHTDQASYALGDALQGRIRGVYHLQTGDGSPLRNVTVSVRILRQVQNVGFTDHEDWNGTTDANGDFVFHPSTAFDLPVNYLLLGSVQTTGIAGAANGSYSVKLA